MSNRHWLIERREGMTKKWERKVSPRLGHKQIQALLIALAAQGLDDDEIVASYENPRVSGLLEVHWEPPHLRFWCGHEPLFSARFVDPDKPKKGI